MFSRLQKKIFGKRRQSSKKRGQKGAVDSKSLSDLNHCAENRILVLFVLVIGVIGFYGYRLWDLQVINAEQFKDRAQRQYVSSKQGFDRGNIYFTDRVGEKVPAATIAYGYGLAINPRIIKEPEELYNQLEPVLEISKETFMSRAAKSDDPYEEVARQISKKDFEALGVLPNSVVTFKDSWRNYPLGETASQTIGFVGWKGDLLEGRYGLESAFNDELNRKDSSLFSNYFAEAFSNISDSLSTEHIEADVVVTIEPTVQRYVEKVLIETKETWSSEYAGAVVMNPQTGAVIAMAYVPGFDPNNYGDVKNLKDFRNPLVETVEEMGSIIKPITMAAGLDSGVITPQTYYEDSGSITLNGKVISNYDGQARGVVPMQEILSRSLNTGVVYIYQKLGRERFRQYMYDFGALDRTTIGLPNEAKNIVDTLESQYDVDYATASFGQGIALSPLSTAKMLSVLGNGGKLVEPKLVSGLVSDSLFANNTEKEANNPKQVISPETSEQVSRMLVAVVDDVLVGGNKSLPHHSVAAKTGTAEIPRPLDLGGGYYKDRYLHSFFGYFPAYDPQFLVLLYHKYPKNARYASETLTDPFFDITEFLINYYTISPDR